MSDNNRSVRPVSFAVPEELAHQARIEAAKLNISRSQLVVLAIRQFLNNQAENSFIRIRDEDRTKGVATCLDENVYIALQEYANINTNGKIGSASSQLITSGLILLANDDKLTATGKLAIMRLIRRLNNGSH